MRARKASRFASAYLRAVIGSMYLLTLGMLSRRYRALMYQVASHFGYKLDYEPVKPIVPPIPQAGFPDELAIQVRETEEKSGNTSLLEIIFLVKLIRLHRPATIFEIGTFDGRTTLNMAANLVDGGKVYTLDLPKEQAYTTKLPIGPGDRKFILKDVIGARYLGSDCASKITQLTGDSAAFDFSQFNNSIDFVFIDGAHSYEYVANDTARAFQLLRNGRGAIVWHDYGWVNAITRFLNEMYQRDSRFSNLHYIEGTTLAILVAGS